MEIRERSNCNWRVGHSRIGTLAPIPDGLVAEGPGARPHLPQVTAGTEDPVGPGAEWARPRPNSIAGASSL